MLRQSLEALYGKSYPSQDFSELLELNDSLQSARKALQQFCRYRLFSASRIQKAYEALYTPLPEEFSLPTTPHAKEILEELHERHTLALVTVGVDRFQREKLKKAGIDSSIFSKMVIPEESIKKPHYEALVREFLVRPEEVWVCGDRVEIDLFPAHELGAKTIQMRWGRGAHLPKAEWVDVCISHLGELRGII